MDKISLTQEYRQNITILPNEFIDHHMSKADGEYVKIYLMILRFAGKGLPVSPDQLADALELTRKDVIRAIRYWEKEGLLSLESGSMKEAEEGKGHERGEHEQAAPSRTPDIQTRRPSLPIKRTQDAREIDRYISCTDLSRLVFMAETYMGHPLSITELNTIYYISNDLHFSVDLLEYLVEYCSEKGKKQIRYIEKVAVNWYEQGIDTVAKAMDQTALYGQNIFLIMKAFGISGRNPGQSEINYINHWNSLGLGSDIILEACNRTLLATHQASFPYANRILEDWKKAGVQRLSDVHSMDKIRQARTGTENTGADSTKNVPGNHNSFHNFEQRNYDYADLESRLTGNKRR